MDDKAWLPSKSAHCCTPSGKAHYFSHKSIGVHFQRINHIKRNNWKTDLISMQVRTIVLWNFNKLIPWGLIDCVSFTTFSNTQYQLVAWHNYLHWISNNNPLKNTVLIFCPCQKHNCLNFNSSNSHSFNTALSQDIFHGTKLMDKFNGLYSTSSSRAVLKTIMSWNVK